MTVHVIAKIPTKDDVHRILDGWQEAMTRPNGPDLVGGSPAGAGVAVGPPGTAIEDDGPDLKS